MTGIRIVYELWDPPHCECEEPDLQEPDGQTLGGKLLSTGIDYSGNFTMLKKNNYLTVPFSIYILEKQVHEIQIVVSHANITQGP